MAHFSILEYATHIISANQSDFHRMCNILSPHFPGKDKLGVPASEPVRLVLECDRTQVEDGEYFRTLANNTVLLLLRQGERWYPTGVDAIKAGE